MYTDSVSAIVKRELETLQNELLAYENESDIWATPTGITNSAGTLALHLCGNLRHFIGAHLGATGYQRQRDAEFTNRNVARTEMLALIDQTISEACGALDQLVDDQLENMDDYSFGQSTAATSDFLIHLVSHLAFHLGQVNYHRRIITGVRGNVPVLELGKLHTMS